MIHQNLKANLDYIWIQVNLEILMNHRNSRGGWEFYPLQMDVRGTEVGVQSNM